MERRYYRTHKKADGTTIQYSFTKTIKGTSIVRKPIRDVVKLMESIPRDEWDVVLKLVKEHVESLPAPENKKEE